MTTKTLRPPYKRLSIFNLWASGGGAAEGQTLLTGNQSGRPTSFKPYRPGHAVSFGAAFSFGCGGVDSRNSPYGENHLLGNYRRGVV